LISFDEALDLVRENKFRWETEYVELESANGRVLAEDIAASHASPRFDNSAVDGFAVSGPNSPWRVVGTIAAGESGAALGSGEAARVMTGAAAPLGTFAVLMQEDCELDQSLLRSGQAVVRDGMNIRRQGEEFSFGDVVVAAGTRINPMVLGSLRSLGLPEAPVRSMPRVAILSTGTELVEPGCELEPSQIYESNSLPIAAVLRGLGAESRVEHVEDDREQTEATVRSMLEEVDLLITTGGASVGAFDFVPSTLASLGFQFVFSKVAMKPGKPVAFGMREDGKAWFGLPGNPMSAQATFLLLVLPYLDSELGFFRFKLLNGHHRKPGREEFIPANLHIDPEPGVSLLPSVGSHATAGFAVSNGMARIPASIESLSPGEEVQFAFFPWSRLP
jgi:molybdopterin molybdotransferase